MKKAELIEMVNMLIPEHKRIYDKFNHCVSCRKPRIHGHTKECLFYKFKNEYRKEDWWGK